MSLKSLLAAREAACNQSQLFPFIHDKIFVWIQKKESQGCHTAGNLSTIGFLLYDSALCLDPHMESSLTDFVYRALYRTPFLWWRHFQIFKQGTSLPAPSLGAKEKTRQQPHDHFLMRGKSCGDWCVNLAIKVQTTHAHEIFYSRFAMK